MPGDCPKGGDHNPVHDSETETTVTHKCTKCKATFTRNKGNRLVNLACLVVAVLVYAALMTSIFLAAAAQPAQP